MIVDVHTHIPTHMDTIPNDDIKEDTQMRPGERVRLSTNVDDYLAGMETVDTAFVFGIRRRPTDEDSPVFPWKGDVNDTAAKVVSRAPDKIIGFMSVHPDEADVIEEIERCVDQLGLRGIKLGPNYQDFDPKSENAFKVYERAQALGLPIVFHQGTSPYPQSPLRYAHPLVMDEIAMAFPELRVVMAHIAHPWHVDCIAVIRKHPHVYADVSGALIRPLQAYNAFRLAYEWGVLHKFLFASDFPVTTPAETIEFLQNFNEFARQYHMPEVPADELEAIIHRDSLSLLGLK